MTAIATEPEVRTPTNGATTQPRRRVLPWLVLGLAVVLGAVWGWRRLSFVRHHVTTDNAQLEGHITTIAPRVQDFIARVLVEDNQRVSPGDTLVVLDDRDFRVRLAQAEADLKSAQAAVGGGRREGQAPAQRAASVATAAGAEAAVAAAEATLRKATADLERYRTLAAQKIISEQQLDQAQWAVDNGRAAVESARKQAVAAASQSVAADAQVTMAGARLASAQAAVETARLQLSYTVILAPAAGVVAKRAAEPGAQVQVGQSLLALVQDRETWVTANLKETQLDRVRVGDPVEFTVDAYPGVTFRGTVESLSPASGARFALLPPDNATGNFTKVVQRVPVRIRVDGPRDPARPLRPGMSVDVSIKIS